MFCALFTIPSPKTNKKAKFFNDLKTENLELELHISMRNDDYQSFCMEDMSGI